MQILAFLLLHKTKWHTLCSIYSVSKFFLVLYVWPDAAHLLRFSSFIALCRCYFISISYLVVPFALFLYSGQNLYSTKSKFILSKLPFFWSFWCRTNHPFYNSKTVSSKFWVWFSPFAFILDSYTYASILVGCNSWTLWIRSRMKVGLALLCLQIVACQFVTVAAYRVFTLNVFVTLLTEC